MQKKKKKKAFYSDEESGSDSDADSESSDSDAEVCRPSTLHQRQCLQRRSLMQPVHTAAARSHSTRGIVLSRQASTRPAVLCSERTDSADGRTAHCFMRALRIAPTPVAPLKARAALAKRRRARLGTRLSSTPTTC